MTKKTDVNWLRHFDIEDYLDDCLGVFRTATGANGDEHICECPFCGKFAKLYVNAETGLWLCYRCGERGSFPMLIMEIEGVSWREARKKLTAASGEHLSRSIDDMRARREKKRVRKAKRMKTAQATAALPEEYIPCWDEELQAWRRIGYLTDTRGFRMRTAKLFKLGICLDGQYAGRAIFPIVENGEIKSFQARATGDWKPKYMNPPDVDKGVFIYGHDIVAGQTTVVVVEGPTDVVSCYQKGIPACALLGKTSTMAQVTKLRSLGAEEVVLLLDGDAGDDTLKTALLISEVMPVRVARLPGSMDPDDAPKPMLLEALRTASSLTARELRRIRHA